MVMQSHIQWLQELETQLEAEHQRIEGILTGVRNLREYLLAQQPAVQSASKEAIIQELQTILASNGQPIHRTRLHQHLAEKGIHVGGRNPVANLGAIMSREDAFYSAGNGEWGLTVWKRPMRHENIPQNTPVPLDNALANGYNRNRDEQAEYQKAGAGR